MHNWGDENVDWEGINDAASFIADYCRKWGRLSAHGKEKYGTVRVYVGFGHISLHGLVYPGYVYNQFPAWLWTLDCDYIGRVLQFFFEKPFTKWQIFIYNKAYQHALHKWPHLRAEILVDADYLEYIRGATQIKGRHTIIVGWNGEPLGSWVRLDEDNEQ